MMMIHAYLHANLAVHTCVEVFVVLEQQCSTVTFGGDLWRPVKAVMSNGEALQENRNDVHKQRCVDQTLVCQQRRL
eukprot:351697-Chlamydomonas_euryale.AAC.2